MNSIPDQAYDKSLRKKMKKLDVKSITKYFVELAKQNHNLVNDIIATYIKEEKKLVESRKISSGTLESQSRFVEKVL